MLAALPAPARPVDSTWLGLPLAFVPITPQNRLSSTSPGQYGVFAHHLESEVELSLGPSQFRSRLSMGAGNGWNEGMTSHPAGALAQPLFLHPVPTNSQHTMGHNPWPPWAG